MPERRILKELGKGIGRDDAEASAETVFDLELEGIVLILAPGVGVFRNAPQDLDRPQQVTNRAEIRGRELTGYSR